MSVMNRSIPFLALRKQKRKVLSRKNNTPNPYALNMYAKLHKALYQFSLFQAVFKVVQSLMYVLVNVLCRHALLPLKHHPGFFYHCVFKVWGVHGSIFPATKSRPNAQKTHIHRILSKRHYLYMLLKSPILVIFPIQTIKHEVQLLTLNFDGI